MFNLEQSIENWRNELFSISTDDRRELETHLRDAFTGLQQRGLSDEESFLIARRRIGHPEQLTGEFIKSNPVAVWRERLFWMWLALFLGKTESSLFQSVQLFFLSFSKYWQIVAAVGFILFSLIPALLVILLAKGRLFSPFSKVMQLLENRKRLLRVVVVCVAVSAIMRILALSYLHARNQGQTIVGILIMPIFYYLITGVILVWLLPPSGKRILKSA